MELLDYLFTFIFVIYLIRMALRFLLPMLFKSVVNKAQQNQQGYGSPNPPPVGKIKVDYIPENKKNTVPDSEGEFIDYEEIK
jgi:hypothetical protein